VCICPVLGHQGRRLADHPPASWRDRTGKALQRAVTGRGGDGAMASIAYAYCSPSPPMRYPHASGDDNAVEIGGYETHSKVVWVADDLMFELIQINARGGDLREPASAPRSAAV